jgi:hypothetical protein
MAVAPAAEGTRAGDALPPAQRSIRRSSALDQVEPSAKRTARCRAAPPACHLRQEVPTARCLAQQIEPAAKRPSCRRELPPRARTTNGLQRGRCTAHTCEPCAEAEAQRPVHHRADRCPHRCKPIQVLRPAPQRLRRLTGHPPREQAARCHPCRRVRAPVEESRAHGALTPRHCSTAHRAPCIQTARKHLEGVAHSHPQPPLHSHVGLLSTCSPLSTARHPRQHAATQRGPAPQGRSMGCTSLRYRTSRMYTLPHLQHMSCASLP